MNRRWSFCLVFALSFQILVGGKWNYLLAPWISLPLFVHFVRHQTNSTALCIGFFAFALVTGISMYGIVPLPFPLYIAFIGAMTLLLYGGFYLDRWAIGKSASLWSLLVYPAYMVLLEGVVSLGPFGTWNSLAYTQANNLPLIQLVSITGIWGVTFLIALTASVISKVGMERLSRTSIGKLLVPLAAIVIVVHAWGLMRAKSYEEKETIEVGACNASAPALPMLRHIITSYVQQASPADEASLYRNATRFRQQELLLQAERLALMNYEVIFWPEASAIVLEDDEREFTERLSAIASEQKTCIIAPMAVIRYGSSLITNKIVLIPHQNGEVEYIKSIIPPGEPSVKGSGELKTLDFRWGRLSAAICFDLDFPRLIRQAGKQRANLLVVPALDWKEIAHIHAAMAKFRAVENGCSLIRYAEGGLYSVANPVGETLHIEIFADAQNRLTPLSVPTNRLVTFYSLSGDWFFYVVAVGFVFLICFLIHNSKSKSVDALHVRLKKQ